MKKLTTSAAVVPAAIVEDAWQEVGASFERFCLTAGIATLATMMRTRPAYQVDRWRLRHDDSSPIASKGDPSDCARWRGRMSHTIDLAKLVDKLGRAEQLTGSDDAP